jgi:hypothetical protein
MDFKRMTVRAKLTMAFGTLTALVLLVSVLSLMALSAANDRFSGYVSGINARMILATQIRAGVDRRAIAARNLVLVTQQSDVDLEKASVNESHADVQARIKQLKEAIAQATDATPRARELVANIDQVESQYGPVALAIVNAALNHDRDKAVTMMNEQCRPLLAKLEAATTAFTDYTHERALDRQRLAAEDYAAQRALSIGICLASLVGAIVAAILITRSLTRALGAEPGSLCEISQRVAAGDLSPVSGVQTAPPGSVLASMGEMQGSLVRLIGQVRAASDSIATGSSQIASGNQDLSSRTEQQAASLQATASSKFAGGECVGCGAARQHSGGAGRQYDDRYQRKFFEDRGHHRHHRRHRVPDEYPGAQCGGGSRACGRAGPRVCSRGKRGSQSRSTFVERGQRDQRPDRGIGTKG